MNSGFSFGVIRRQNRKKTDSFFRIISKLQIWYRTRQQWPSPSVFRLKWFLVGILRLENTFSRFRKAFSREIKGTACKGIQKFWTKACLKNFRRCFWWKYTTTLRALVFFFFRLLENLKHFKYVWILDYGFEFWGTKSRKSWIWYKNGEKYGKIFPANQSHVWINQQ